MKIKASYHNVINKIRNVIHNNLKPNMQGMFLITSTSWGLIKSQLYYLLTQSGTHKTD